MVDAASDVALPSAVTGGASGLFGPFTGQITGKLLTAEAFETALGDITSLPISPSNLGRKAGRYAVKNCPSRLQHSVGQLQNLKLQYTADEILNANRAGSGLISDPNHRAPTFLGREQLETGVLFDLFGGDGVKVRLLQMEGMVNGKKGIFEFIVEQNGNVTHQLFKPGATITGLPGNRRPR